MERDPLRFRHGRQQCICSIVAAYHEARECRHLEREGHFALEQRQLCGEIARSVLQWRRREQDERCARRKSGQRRVATSGWRSKVMRLVNDDAVERRRRQTAAAQRLVRHDCARHAGALSSVAPGGAKRRRRNDERLLPPASQCQRNVGLASAHLFCNETSAMCVDGALRASDDATLIVPELHCPERSLGQRVETGSGDRGARDSQVRVGM
jgi:hypothetical protein